MLSTFLSSLAIITLVIVLAQRMGYFTLPEKRTWEGRAPYTWEIVVAFLVYYALQVVIVPPLIFLLITSMHGEELISDPSFPTAALVAFTALPLCVVFLVHYGRFRGLQLWEKWPRQSSARFRDISMGLATWFIAFPVATTLAMTLREGVDLWLGLPEADQSAVRFLKDADTVGTFLLLPSYILYGPICEELLFRGFLQTTFRAKYGRVSAIFMTATLFSVSHFAISQGSSNIELLAALFVLGSFMSFLYERQGSLLAPIALHCLFNALSVAMILAGLQG